MNMKIKLLLVLLSLAICWNTEQVFVVCEGNFNSANGSLWTITDEEVYEYANNPIGDVVQSALVHNNQLFIIVNVSSNIQVFDITNDGLNPTHVINTNYSGPREMLVYNNSKKSADVALLNEDGSFIMIFEIYNTSRTKEINRPEPWCEINVRSMLENRDDIIEKNQYDIRFQRKKSFHLKKKKDDKRNQCFNENER